MKLVKSKRKKHICKAEVIDKNKIRNSCIRKRETLINQTLFFFSKENIKTVTRSVSHDLITK